MRQGHFIAQDQKISYLELGAPAEIPILFFHGFPGSSDQALMFLDFLDSHRLHIISPDRPGYGESSRANVYDFDDFLQGCLKLVTNKGWHRFHVVGVSGGGPYARMMSLLFPEQVLSCTTICGLGLLDKKNILTMKAYERWGLRLIRHLPEKISQSLIARLLKRVKPEHALKKMLAEASVSDLPVLKESRIQKIMIQSFQKATKQGADGIHYDLLIYARKLERTLGAFSCPVVLFHAVEDQVVPFSMSEHLAKKIPHAELIRVLHEGHYSLPIKRASLIADKLVSLHGPFSAPVK